MAEQTTPGQRYRQFLGAGEIHEDPFQKHYVEQLDEFYQRFSQIKPPSGFFSRFKKTPSIKGVYVYGSVGRGKTWLTDLLYDCLPEQSKSRFHFHAFMRDIHDQMKGVQGKSDPLRHIASRFAISNRVIFLDEFHVVDIADAMILGRLLKWLFEESISLITTSNVKPEDLYREGIQRASFLPAIALLEQHTQVISLDGDRDYRSEVMQSMPVYLLAQEANVESQFVAEFERLTIGHEIEQNAELQICSRSVPFRRKAMDVIWFSFRDLCMGPRSSADYLEIARTFHTLFIEGIPFLDGSHDDCVRRFIYMIDICYDHKVKLVISADVPTKQLYGGERLAFEFQRTVSRLLEMQSEEYLQLPHKP